MSEKRKLPTRGAKPQLATGLGGMGISVGEVKSWIGGLYIELQLARREIADYSQALSQAREELRKLREEVSNGEKEEES